MVLDDDSELLHSYKLLEIVTGHGARAEYIKAGNKMYNQQPIEKWAFSFSTRLCDDHQRTYR